MIISDSIAPIETITLPEPCQRSLGSIPSEGWESVLKIAESGRVWRLDFGADARPQVRPTGLGLRRELEFDDFDPIDFAADRLVLEFDEHLHVFDVSTGRVRLRVPVKDSLGAPASLRTDAAFSASTKTRRRFGRSPKSRRRREPPDYSMRARSLCPCSATSRNRPDA